MAKHLTKNKKPLPSITLTPQPLPSPICGECQYALPRGPETVSGREEMTHFCRGGPPGVVLTAEGKIMTVWPVVLTREWCGVFRRRGS